MSNHTPGPWICERAMWDTDTRDVAYILDGIKEARAPDARLISAAPDLYAALINMLDDGDKTDREQAIRAIAKAEGRS